MESTIETHGPFICVGDTVIDAREITVARKTGDHEVTVTTSEGDDHSVSCDFESFWDAMKRVISP